MENKKTLKNSAMILGDNTCDDGHYVYALSTKDDPKNIFYIGEGVCDRVLDHESFIKDAKKQYELQGKKANHELTNKEKMIWDNIDNIECTIIKYGLTKHEAFMCEDALINYCDFIGKKLTNIQAGNASKREKESPFGDQGALSIDKFIEYGNNTVDITYSKSFPYKIMFIHLNKSLKSLFVEDDKYIYYSSCAAWEMADDKINDIEFVISLYNGFVVGIYPVDASSWYLVKERPLDDIDENYYTKCQNIMDVIEAKTGYSHLGQNFFDKKSFVKNNTELPLTIKNLFRKKVTCYKNADDNIKQQKGRYNFN